MAEETLNFEFSYDSEDLGRKLAKTGDQVRKASRSIVEGFSAARATTKSMAGEIQHLRRELDALKESAETRSRINEALAGATLGYNVPGPPQVKVPAAAGGALIGAFHPEMRQAIARTGEDAQDKLNRLGGDIGRKQRTLDVERDLARLSGEASLTEEQNRELRETMRDLVSKLLEVREGQAVFVEILRSRLRGSDRPSPMLSQQAELLKQFDDRLRGIGQASSDEVIQQQLANASGKGGSAFFPFSLDTPALGALERAGSVETKQQISELLALERELNEIRSKGPLRADPDRLDQVLEQIRELRGNLGPLSAELTETADGVTKSISMWEAISDTAQQVHKSVKFWLVDRFTEVVTGVEDATGEVLELWNKLKDELVDNSIVPDMIRAIGGWFSKLPGMVAVPTDDATEAVAASFEKLGDGVPGGLGSAGGDAGGDGNEIRTPEIVPGGGKGTVDVKGMVKVTGEVISAFETMGSRVGQEISNMIRTGEVSFGRFKDFLGNLAGSIQNSLHQAFVTKPLTNFFEQLISTGASSLLGGFGPSVPARAHGGPVRGGQAVLVGERGPELFLPRAPGRVFSHRQSMAALASVADSAPRRSMGDGRNVNLTINMPPGTSARDARASAGQIGAEISRQLRLHDRRNN